MIETPLRIRTLKNEVKSLKSLKKSVYTALRFVRSGNTNATNFTTKAMNLQANFYASLHANDTSFAMPVR